MLFSSITFLYYFLPWVVVLYFLVPRKLKKSGSVRSKFVFLCLGRTQNHFLYAYFYFGWLYA